MARSSGFKINRHLHNLLRDCTPLFWNTLSDNQRASFIYEIRSIVGKYQPITSIENDLAEIVAEASEEAQDVDDLANQVQSITNGD